MPNIDKLVTMLAYENGEMTWAEELAFFQEIVNDGSVWGLDAIYGRRACQLMRLGLILPRSLDTLANQTALAEKSLWGG